MSARSATLAGRRAAEKLMTDEWAVYRDGAEVFNPATGQYEASQVTVYLGPGKMQTFESYEQSPAAAGHTYTVMRPHLHLPVNDETAQVEPHDVAVCLSSEMDPDIVGTEVRIAGVVRKTFMTARRFPVSEVQA